MLRVMIVEDEDMIRKGLVFTIDWLSMDCVVVAEASNGQEVYERILEYKPDVVLTDICTHHRESERTLNSEQSLCCRSS